MSVVQRLLEDCLEEMGGEMFQRFRRDCAGCLRSDIRIPDSPCAHNCPSEDDCFLLQIEASEDSQ